MKQVEDIETTIWHPMIVSLVLQKAKCNLYPFREFQQFLVNYKLKDENEHEVTPFISSLQ